MVAWIQKVLTKGGSTLQCDVLGGLVERIQIPLKAGHHRPAIERWLGSLENFRGSGPVLQGNPIFL